MAMAMAIENNLSAFFLTAANTKTFKLNYQHLHKSLEPSLQPGNAMVYYMEGHWVGQRWGHLVSSLFVTITKHTQ